MDLSALDPAKRKALAEFLSELCGFATHQFGDKRGEWGIEEFCFEKLGLLDPDATEDEDDDDALCDAREEIISEFTKVFEAGLQARGWLP